jgi:hypothetical protein
MPSSSPAQASTRRASKILVVGSLVGITSIAVAIGCQSLTSPSSTAGSPPTAGIGSEHRGSPASPTGVPHSAHREAPASPLGVLRRDHHGQLGIADGAVPDGTTVFDDVIPAIANLDPKLLHALHEAAKDAARDRVEIDVNSGWRSRKNQEQLFGEAVSKYGSEAEAARWVAIPGTSAHESGDAVDIGPSGAAAWLSEHGAGYGLCQIYGNERWHYELRPEAADHGCPPMYADPTHDPRMQQ